MALSSGNGPRTERLTIVADVHATMTSWRDCSWAGAGEVATGAIRAASTVAIRTDWIFMSEVYEQAVTAAPTGAPKKRQSSGNER